MTHDLRLYSSHDRNAWHDHLATHLGLGPICQAASTGEPVLGIVYVRVHTTLNLRVSCYPVTATGRQPTGAETLAI